MTAALLALRGDPIGAEWWVRLRCGHDGFVTSAKPPRFGQPTICWRCSATGYVREPIEMLSSRWRP